MLAVPDLPTFARRFKFGRLRKARESLGYGGITSGDVGFDDIVQLHNEQQSNTQITPNDITELSFGPDLDLVFSEGELVDFEVKNRLTFEYRDDFKPAGINF